MSKRVFDEISDEEWLQHDFNPSRVFGTSSSNRKPPPIKSFAFQPHSREFSNHEVINLDDDEDDDGGKVIAAVVRAPQGSRSRRLVVEDDSDYSDGADKLVVTAEVKEMTKKVPDDDEDVDFDFSFSDDDDWEGIKGRAEKEETDLVGKELQKCAKISASLRQELYGSSSAQGLGRYAETEISAARIVTQVMRREPSSGIFWALVRQESEKSLIRT